eukprot:gnl/Dysnectes_brevis/4737_a6510_291.p1 GENE.gnl/Dysnectes_brevis/4737_a6510_291~~gnl/Dysnectes_brevis/4737_a6510_291.p1  ORF type:complete len:1182 (-),score=58.70 gnl/Dysnectes_brevis/4737_a6510_291:2684-5857(-)
MESESFRGLRSGSISRLPSSLSPEDIADVTLRVHSNKKSSLLGFEPATIATPAVLSELVSKLSPEVVGASGVEILEFIGGIMSQTGTNGDMASVSGSVKSEISGQIRKLSPTSVQESEGLKTFISTSKTWLPRMTGHIILESYIRSGARLDDPNLAIMSKEANKGQSRGLPKMDDYIRFGALILAESLQLPKLAASVDYRLKDKKTSQSSSSDLSLSLFKLLPKAVMSLLGIAVLLADGIESIAKNPDLSALLFPSASSSSSSSSQHHRGSHFRTASTTPSELGSSLVDGLTPLPSPIVYHTPSILGRKDPSPKNESALSSAARLMVRIIDQVSFSLDHELSLGISHVLVLSGAKLLLKIVSDPRTRHYEWPMDLVSRLVTIGSQVSPSTSQSSITSSTTAMSRSASSYHSGGGGLGGSGVGDSGALHLRGSSSSGSSLPGYLRTSPHAHSQELPLLPGMKTPLGRIKDALSVMSWGVFFPNSDPDILTCDVVQQLLDFVSKTDNYYRSRKIDTYNVWTTSACLSLASSLLPNIAIGSFSDSRMPSLHILSAFLIDRLQTNDRLRAAALLTENPSRFGEIEQEMEVTVLSALRALYNELCISRCRNLEEQFSTEWTKSPKSPAELAVFDSILESFPFLFKLSIRANRLRTKLKSRSKKTADSHTLKMDRKNILQSIKSSIMKTSAAHLRKPLRVEFTGEAGLDMRGLRREFARLASETLLGRPDAFILPRDKSSSGWNCVRQGGSSSDSVWLHLALGRLSGICIREGLLLDAEPSLGTCVRLVNTAINGATRPVHCGHAFLESPAIYRQLEWLQREGLGQYLDIMGESLRFVIDDPLTPGLEIELIPRGAQLQVTEDTLPRYLSLVVNHLASSSCIGDFAKGFFDLVSHREVALFSPHELRLLLAGKSQLSSAEFLKSITWKGFDDVDDDRALLKGKGSSSISSLSSDVRKCFESVVRRFDSDSSLDMLLCFITGSKRAPYGGLGLLQPPLTVQRVRSKAELVSSFSYDSVDYKQPQRLPSSSTCFNLFKLPSYTDSDALHRVMSKAVTEGQTFEFN